MLFLSLFLFTPFCLFTSVHGDTLPAFGDKNSWEIKPVFRRETATLPPQYLHLPVFLDSETEVIDKEHFSPSRGTGQEPLPERIREILLPLRSGIKRDPHGGSAVPVKVSCRQETMVVQVSRGVLASGQHLHVKLGTCQPNKYNKEVLIFEYDLRKCGTKRTVSNNQVAYSNMLKYDVPKFQGPIRRAVPFRVTVACYFNRYLYTYKIGYTPKMEIQNIFKSMKNTVQFTLTPMDAHWERLSPSGQYVLGMPMYFQAEASSVSPNQRLYVHLCYATPEKSHSSRPQFPVVKNFGCMVDSKDNHSRFIPYQNNIVRFSVGSVLFKAMPHQLYMHCSMSVDSPVPTPTAKSCNYDAHAGRWVELYGLESVCACCDSICSSSASTVTKMISSKPWTVKSNVRFTSPKRKSIPTSSSTTTTAEPQFTRKKTPRRTTLQSAGTLDTMVDKLDTMSTALKWPGYGEATLAKGHKAKEMNTKATIPRTVFEEIFVFD